jgi:hypothetical protein
VTVGLLFTATVNDESELVDAMPAVAFSAVLLIAGIEVDIILCPARPLREFARHAAPNSQLN